MTNRTESNTVVHAVDKKQQQYIDNAINDIRGLIPHLSKSKISASRLKATKLPSWLKKYSNMMKQESGFEPLKLISYKRGQVIKANLGCRIGREYCFSHYAIVLDNDNALSSDTVTIIPLTSVKKDTDVENLRFTDLYIGEWIYNDLSRRYDASLFETVNLVEKLTVELALLRTRAEKIVTENTRLEMEIAQGVDDSATHAKQKELDRKTRLTNDEIRKSTRKCDNLKRKVKSVQLLSKEVNRMKKGSIALAGQITTISKQRIQYPCYKNDVLANIKVPNDILDKIDEKVIQLFIGK